MGRWISSIAVLAAFGCGFLLLGVHPLSAQSDTCVDMKKEISEMKADLKEYEAGRRLDTDDISELRKEAADIRKDLDEYVTDSKSEPNEISKAKEGLQLVALMEEGLNEGRKGKVLSNYSKIIELYEWFYENEDCE